MGSWSSEEIPLHRGEPVVSSSLISRCRCLIPDQKISSCPQTDLGLSWGSSGCHLSCSTSSYHSGHLLCDCFPGRHASTPQALYHLPKPFRAKQHAAKMGGGHREWLGSQMKVYWPSPPLLLCRLDLVEGFLQVTALLLWQW